MKMFDKIKDLFTDEVVEEEEEPVTKEVIQVEIPAPKPVEKEEIEQTMEVPVKPKAPERTVFFDETDFDDIKRTNVSLDELYREAEKPKYEEKREAYSAKKEVAVKHFEPTPIISPVYGVLDKNYKKDDIVDKAELPKASHDMTIDDVRNKAYGTLEDELESTLFGKTAILFQNEEKEETKKEIEQDLEKTADAIDMLKEEVEPKHAKSTTDDLSDNLIAEALDEDLEKEDKLSESDLFSLIDDMYGKGDK